MRIARVFKSLSAAPLGRRLWLAWGSYALFIAIIIGANWVLAPGGHVRPGKLGHDFLPFYTAGRLVDSGNQRLLYDLPTIRRTEHVIAQANGLELGDAIGPFWNPPFYALIFVPLAKLRFFAALACWEAVNFAAVLASLALLWQTSRRADVSAAHQALFPLAVLTSVPFILAFTHGQNSGASLLLLTIVITLWRRRKAFAAGLVAAMLGYKPQLAALAALILAIDLGWPAIKGMCLGAGALVVLMLAALPGSIPTYLGQLPHILHYMQVENPYLWERHVTFTAFWRLLIQGHAVGEATGVVRWLAAVCSIGLILILAISAWRGRIRKARRLLELADFGAIVARRDGLIAATVLAMPLAMPFYFDYDLLLLAAPAALLIRLARPDRIGRWTLALGCGLYGGLTLTTDLALLTRINLAVPLLVGLTALAAARGGTPAVSAFPRRGQTLPPRLAA